MARRLDFIATKLLQFQEISRRHALPVTAQRRIVLETLAARIDHPTADQLYDEVRHLLPGISRTTVYRVLDTFVRTGLIRKISTPAARARFDADTSRHHHLSCVGCEKVLDLFDQRLDQLPVPRKEGEPFVVQDYSVTFTGVCAACQQGGVPADRENPVES